MPLEIKYKLELEEYEKLNQLFVYAIQCQDNVGSTIPDELLNDFHDLFEEVANNAYDTGTKQ